MRRSSRGLLWRRAGPSPGPSAVKQAGGVTNQLSSIKEGAGGGRPAGAEAAPGLGGAAKLSTGRGMGAVQRRGAARRDTHTHTPDKRAGRERASLVRPAARPQRPGAPTGQESRPAALGDLTCGLSWAARREPGFHGKGPRDPTSSRLGGLPRPPAAPFPSAARPSALRMTSQAQETDPGLTRQVNDEPAIHFILLRHEGAGAVGVFGGRGGAEEEAGEALEHGGGRSASRGRPMAVQKPGNQKDVKVTTD